MTALRKWISRFTIVILAATCAALFFRTRFADSRRVHAVQEAARLTGIVGEMKRMGEVKPSEEIAGVVKAGARVVSHARAAIQVEGHASGSGLVTSAAAPEQSGLCEEAGEIQILDDHHRFTIGLPYTFRGGRLSTGRPSWAVRQKFSVDEYQVEAGEGWRGITLTLIEQDPETGEELGRYTADGKVIEASYVPTVRAGLRRFGWTAGAVLAVAPDGRQAIGLGLAWGLRW